MIVEELISAQLPLCAQLRHQLHEIPELGYEEFKTAAAVRAELMRVGVDGIAGFDRSLLKSVVMV